MCCQNCAMKKDTPLNFCFAENRLSRAEPRTGPLASVPHTYREHGQGEALLWLVETDGVNLLEHFTSQALLHLCSDKTPCTCFVARIHGKHTAAHAIQTRRIYVQGDTAILVTRHSADTTPTRARHCWFSPKASLVCW